MKRNRVRGDRLVFDLFMENLGYFTDQAKADALGLSRTVVLKTRAETQAPSSEFIAACRTTYPKVPFDRFFESVTD